MTAFGAAPRMRCAAVLSVAATVALPIGAEPLVYALDPAHSFVHFEVLHFHTSTLRGRFGPLRGDVVIDTTARRGEVGVRIPTGGVSTGIRLLDRRLQASDLLDAGAWPEAFFVASNFEFDAAGGVAAVRGEFTLRGTSAPLTLKAVRFRCRSSDRAAETCGGDFEAELLRSAFGADLGVPWVGDRVRLLIQVEGVRRP